MPGVPGRGVGDSPVVLASVGTYSGPVGAASNPILLGVQVWVRHINRTGGLQGHPVALVVYDDGGDPARHRAQIQDAVEQRHAIAFLGNMAPLTGQASVQYVTAHRIPVIGGTGGEGWAYTSPMFFPPLPQGPLLARTLPSGLAEQVIPKGKTKLGTLVCAEAQICSDGARAFEESAGAVGFNYVYKAKFSIAQPDFTAECLAARNAQVEVLFVLADQNSVGRVAAGCLRQAYRPVFGIAGQVLVDRQKDDPNLDGLVGIAPVFPGFQDGTPASDEFQQAMRAYGGSGAERLPAASGWVAAKLFEKAAARLSEPPTSEAILAGLWSIKNDTLGGLTGPLTFVQNQPPTNAVCWWPVVVHNRTFVSPDGFKLHCV